MKGDDGLPKVDERIGSPAYDQVWTIYLETLLRVFQEYPESLKRGIRANRQSPRVGIEEHPRLVSSHDGSAWARPRAKCLGWTQLKLNLHVVWENEFSVTLNPKYSLVKLIS